MKLLPLLVCQLMLSSISMAQESDVEVLRSLANQGDSAAQFDMGNRYLYGDGVEVDSF